MVSSLYGVSPNSYGATTYPYGFDAALNGAVSTIPGLSTSTGVYGGTTSPYTATTYNSYDSSAYNAYGYNGVYRERSGFASFFDWIGRLFGGAEKGAKRTADDMYNRYVEQVRTGEQPNIALARAWNERAKGDKDNMIKYALSLQNEYSSNGYNYFQFIDTAKRMGEAYPTIGAQGGAGGLNAAQEAQFNAHVNAFRNRLTGGNPSYTHIRADNLANLIMADLGAGQIDDARLQNYITTNKLNLSLRGPTTAGVIAQTLMSQVDGRAGDPHAGYINLATEFPLMFNRAAFGTGISTGGSTGTVLNPPSALAQSLWTAAPKDANGMISDLSLMTAFSTLIPVAQQNDPATIQAFIANNRLPVTYPQVTARMGGSIDTLTKALAIAMMDSSDVGATGIGAGTARDRLLSQAELYNALANSGTTSGTVRVI